MLPFNASKKEPFPKYSGTYALILNLPGAQSIRIGKLGKFDFPAGYYVYIGSAFGPGGLAGRLNRHRQLVQDIDGRKRLHWHIDYLRQRAELTGIWVAVQNTPHEHRWALLVSQLPGATMPVPRFGASDCRCPTHLFHFSKPPAWANFKQILQVTSAADHPASLLNKI
jgi:Uri superfamily endonuclease